MKLSLTPMLSTSLKVSSRFVQLALQPQEFHRLAPHTASHSRQDVEKASEAADKLSGGFDDVRVNILTFKSAMKAAMGDAKANMEREIQDVNDTITQLNDDIKYWTDVVSG